MVTEMDEIFEMDHQMKVGAQAGFSWNQEVLEGYKNWERPVISELKIKITTTGASLNPDGSGQS